jgi:hypothetical protein
MGHSRFDDEEQICLLKEIFYTLTTLTYYTISYTNTKQAHGQRRQEHEEEDKEALFLLPLLCPLHVVFLGRADM